MSRKIHASLLILVLALTTIALNGRVVEPTANAAPAASYELLSQLPDSDFILYADAQRVLTDIVPNLLMTRPEDRARFEADLDRFQKDAGFDPRTIDAVAVGVNLNSSQRASDHDFAIIARGRFDANATIDAGFNAAIKRRPGSIERQSQQYEGRTIYLLAPVAQRQAMSVPQTDETGAPILPPKSVSGEEQNRAATQDRSMAFVALDPNTIAFGYLKSVRATIDANMGKGRVTDELVQLATRTPNAAVSFSGSLTPEMVKNFRIGHSKAEESVASIRQVYGAFNVNGNNAEAFINLRTEAAEQAQQIGTMLKFLKFASSFSRERGAGSKGRSLEALTKDLNIETVGNEVQINLKLAQADLAPFVRRF